MQLGTTIDCWAINSIYVVIRAYNIWLEHVVKESSFPKRLGDKKEHQRVPITPPFQRRRYYTDYAIKCKPQVWPKKTAFQKAS